jgi:ABC-type sugar transport system ATPase subunit
MSDAEQRVAQAALLRHAADVAETLTDDEIAAIGRRIRTTTSTWLRNVADDYVTHDSLTVENMQPALWVMRLLLEQRAATLQNVRLGARNQSG